MNLLALPPQARVYIPGAETLDEDAFENALWRTTDAIFTSHADDAEIAALSPIIDALVDKSRAVLVVVATDGARSPRTGRFADRPDWAIVEERWREAKLSADIGRYAMLINLMYPSSGVRSDAVTAVELTSVLQQLLRAAKPQALFVHQPFDLHDTHMATGLRAVEAARNLPLEDRPERVMGIQVWGHTDLLPPDYLVVRDVSGHEHTAGALIGVHDTQIGGGKKYHRGAQGRRWGNAVFSESYQTDTADELEVYIDLTRLVHQAELPFEVELEDWLEGILLELKAQLLTRWKRILSVKGLARVSQ